MTRAVNYAHTHPREAIASIARRYGVNRTTLSQRVKGTQKERKLAHIKEQLFDLEDEEAIITWVKDMDESGFPINYDLLRQMAQSILRNRHVNHQVGIHWPRTFVNRHPELKTTIAHYQEKCRQSSSANAIAQEMFYHMLLNAIRRWRISAPFLWNCDEKGITMS
jgi:hypothetical protein